MSWLLNIQLTHVDKLGGLHHLCDWISHYHIRICPTDGSLLRTNRQRSHLSLPGLKYAISMKDVGPSVWNTSDSHPSLFQWFAELPISRGLVPHTSQLPLRHLLQV